MGMKIFGEGKVEKWRSSIVSRSRLKLWTIRAMTTIMLWTCMIQLMALGDLWAPRFLNGWPSCFTHSDLPLSVKFSPVPTKLVIPPKSKSHFSSGSPSLFLQRFQLCVVMMDLLTESQRTPEKSFLL